MARRCQLTNKKRNNAFAISHSHRRTKRLQEVNLQWKRIWWEEGKRFVRLRLSTKALKTLKAKGYRSHGPGSRDRPQPVLSFLLSPVVSDSSNLTASQKAYATWAANPPARC
jgi:large subunit ribosomal protein L28